MAMESDKAGEGRSAEKKKEERLRKATEHVVGQHKSMASMTMESQVRNMVNGSVLSHQNPRSRSLLPL